MSLLSLPAEILLLITRDLKPHDVNALVKCHPYLHRTLNPSLYYENVHNHNASALFWSASHGYIKTLEYLLTAGANVLWDSTYQRQNFQPPPVDEDSSSSFLPFKRPKRRQNGDPSSKEHPISIAAANGHIEIVAKFLMLGIDVNYKDPKGRNPLSLAAGGGHLELCRILLNKGAYLLSSDDNDMHSTGHAVVQGHREIEDFLFEEVQKLTVYTEDSSQSDTSIVQQHLHWMLRCAAERGENDRLTLLLTKSEAELNIVPPILQENLVSDNYDNPWYPIPWRSYTPLIAAIQSAPDPISTAKILLKKGADPDILVAIANPFITNEDLGMYENAVSAALERDQSYALIELLIEYGLTPINSEMTLIRATHLKKIDEFRLLLDNGAYYLYMAHDIWRIGYQPILDLLTERGIHSEVKGPLLTWEQLFESFDFDDYLNSEDDSFGFNTGQEPIRSVTPPPHTEAEWARYLNGHFDDNPYPYLVGNAGFHCGTGAIVAFQAAQG
jgi:ankyrin repeat protein